MLNTNLTNLIEKWRKEGSPVQESFDWGISKGNWMKNFPEQSDFIKNLPDEIGRELVRGICSSEVFHIREKFLSVMIWGYGDRGYGPYRVTRMLNQDNADATLSRAFALSQDTNPLAAYEYLQKNRIRNLGPSYGTKFLSFITPRDIGAPIYDSYVAKWVNDFATSDFAGIPTTSDSWRLKTYSFYWNWIRCHAEALGCYPDEIELVLFRDAESRYAINSSWKGK